MHHHFIRGALLAMFATGCNGASGDPVAGEEIYGTYCASCHGATGLGEEESQFPGATNLVEHLGHASDAEIVSVIQDGIGGMPPITALSEDDAADVIAYLRASIQGEHTHDEHDH